MNTSYSQLHQHFTKSDVPAVVFCDGYDFRVSKLQDGRFKLEDRDAESHWFEVNASPFADLYDVWAYVTR